MNSLSSKTKEKLLTGLDSIQYSQLDNAYSQKATTTVKEILHYVEPISANELCLNVLSIFTENPSLYTAPIVNDDCVPVGLIDRGRLTEIFFKPFARDLHHKKHIDEIMTTDPVIVDINTSIDDLANITISAGMRHMANGFIIVESMLYVGMATGHKLLEEITHRKQQELYFLAHYDQLTGIPNRLLFKDRLLQTYQNAKRNDNIFALIFIDMDRFKQVNDTLGHAFGDQLLVNFARRLSKCVRESDTVARLGGDEFVIILQNLNDPAHASKVVSTILDSIRQPMNIYECDINVTASMGVAIFPVHDDTIDGLIRKADAAMYEVKQKGRNGFAVYSDSYGECVMQQDTLETDLKMALANNELSLCYQAQTELENNRVVGVEALLRWQHPIRGQVSPAQFIPFAESCGAIVPIGEWVLREACQQQVAWIQQGLPALRMAVNVSAIQFKEQNFSARVKAIIEETGISPDYLELEVTESVAMSNPLQSVAIMEELRAIGVKIALDDFGTGHSSLSYLARFPINKIKIDQSFVRNIHSSPSNEAIVRAIIVMSDSLGLEMIAEGVESLDELACIKQHNCQEAQGYHFARPIPANQFGAWLRLSYDSN